MKHWVLHYTVPSPPTGKHFSRCFLLTMGPPAPSPYIWSRPRSPQLSAHSTAHSSTVTQPSKESQKIKASTFSLLQAYQAFHPRYLPGISLRISNILDYQAFGWIIQRSFVHIRQNCQINQFVDVIFWQWTYCSLWLNYTLCNTNFQAFLYKCNLKGLWLKVFC